MPNALPVVSLREVTKAFPGYTAFERISLEVRAGSFLSVVGPSGFGKSAVLNTTANGGERAKLPGGQLNRAVSL
jgi:ABC-type nitrate/sulfonate/bicarbonate transport system ATPase subunit